MSKPRISDFKKVCESGTKFEFRKLISKGSDMNHTFRCKHLPLEVAIQSQNTELAKYMIRKGAEMSEKIRISYKTGRYGVYDEKFEYLFQDILANNDPKLIELFLKYGRKNHFEIDYTEWFEYALRNGYEKSVIYLVREFSDKINISLSRGFAWVLRTIISNGMEDLYHLLYDKIVINYDAIDEMFSNYSRGNSFRRKTKLKRLVDTF